MEPLLFLLAIIATAGAIPFLIVYLTVRVTEHENKVHSSEKQRPAISSLAMLFRTFVVLACYALSGYGFLATAVIAIYALLSPQGNIVELPSSVGGIVVLVWLYAWSCHAVMCYGWISNRRVSRFWPISGTIAGIVSFIIFPTAAFFRSLHVFGLSWKNVFFLVAKSFPVVAMEVILVLPCLLLAIFLVSFHLSRSVPDRSMANFLSGKKPKQCCGSPTLR